MAEEFRVCFENVEISNLGNCRRKLHNGNYIMLKGSILKQGGGYRYLQLKRNGKKKNYLFHRWVAKCFIGEQPEDKPYVDHINRNPLDNRVENLRWVSPKENSRNTGIFRVDIEAEGAERHRLLGISTRNNTLEQKKYYCVLCDTNTQCPSHLEAHKNGYRHKLKERTKKEMEDKNIVWSPENYIKFKSIKYDMKRRPHRYPLQSQRIE